MSYPEKLKDPRWQKLRLKVFERDGFKCLCCRDVENTLHVHHLIYSNGEPWDAPMETLETLCKDCHDWRTDFDDLVGKRVITPTIVCFALMRLAVVWSEHGNEEKMAIASNFKRSWEALFKMASEGTTRFK